MSIFKKFIIGDIFQTKQDLFILDGHSSHVTMQAIEQAIEFGLNMVTLPLHTSHVLQPLDVSHLKPFLKELLERLEI